MWSQRQSSSALIDTKRVVEALKASLAERTVVQYGSQVTQFFLFVLWAYGSAPFLPVTYQVLCQYLVCQSMTVGPKNLGTYLSANRNFHLRPWDSLGSTFVIDIV